MAKWPFHAIPPAALKRTFKRDSPLLPWKASGTLGGGGSHFCRRLRGEGTNILQRLRGGGYAFLWALFPKSTTPPNKKFWTVPKGRCTTGKIGALQTVFSKWQQKRYWLKSVACTGHKERRRAPIITYSVEDGSLLNRNATDLFKFITQFYYIFIQI